MKNRKLTFFILVFCSFAVFGGFAASAFAQDAIQCKPPSDAKSGVNLNNNLRLVSATDTANDIYLGTGEIYFGPDFTDPYATKSGSDLFFYSPASILLKSNSDILFQDAAGNRLAGIYSSAAGAGAAQNNNHGLVVDGKIEGWQVNGLNQLCISGSCLQAADRWSGVCDPAKAGNCSSVKTTGDIESGGILSANSNIYTGTGNIYTSNGNIYTTNGKINADNNDINGKRLCIGGACYDSWKAAVIGGMNSTYLGTGTGVFKILAGDGISVSGTGEGDVTVSTKIIWCNGACPAW